MNNINSNAVDHTPQKPGELIRMVAGGLAGCGLHIRYSSYDNPCWFEITDVKDAGCRVTVTDDGDVQLDWTPAVRGYTEPLAIADMAACLLTGNLADRRRDRPRRSTEAATVKTIVGQDLKARGFDVKLEVYRDERAFQALAVIVAANPRCMDLSKVTIADDGSLLWEHDYWPGYSQATREPQCPGRLTRLDEIAGDAATRLSKAISIALPESRSCSTNRQVQEGVQDTAGAVRGLVPVHQCGNNGFRGASGRL